MKTSHLIPYTCGAGAQNKGCVDGPLYLQHIGILSALKARNINVNWLKPNSAAGLNDIAANCEILKQYVQITLQNGDFPVTLGGDHSMAIGTWAGAANTIQKKDGLGLIWIDAHMDAHTKKTSQTGNTHGMPLSYLLGYGDEADAITRVIDKAPAIPPHKLCLVGIRSFEPEEANFLNKLGVRIFTMPEIRKLGLAAVMLEAVKIASAENTAEFGISVDVDVFDPSIAPGTGTIEENGLFVKEFCDAMQCSLKKVSGLVALEIAEYNPHLDEHEITANLITEIIATILATL